MSSTMGSFNIGVSGLRASQRALYVTSHNITNVNTPGYVRQQLMVSESRPVEYGKFHVGIGASIQETRQIRNQFLDNIFRGENDDLNYFNNMSQMVRDVELVLGEIDGEGIQSHLNAFFNAWEELVKDPGSLTQRAMVRQTGSALCEFVNQVAKSLDTLQLELNEKIKDNVDEINDIAGKIAKLNQNIVYTEALGENANDYRDQRNVLMDQLSSIVNVDITNKPDGSVIILLSNGCLVNGNNTYKLSYENNAPSSMFVSPVWEDSGVVLKVTSGVLAANLEARGHEYIENGQRKYVEYYDGSVSNGSVTETDDLQADIASECHNFSPDDNTNGLIPNIRKGLNLLTSLLARGINELHQKGVGIDDAANPSTGLDFFVKINETLPFGIGNIQINPEIDENLNKIAASLYGEVGDPTVAKEIADFKNSRIFQTPGAYLDAADYYRSVISWLGNKGSQYDDATNSQLELVTQVENKRSATSSVSMDEELANMLQFQHAYNASSRFITAVDEMVDIIVNRLKR